MRDSKQIVTNAKRQMFLALATFRKEDRVGMGPRKLDQPNRVVRPVFAVGIHDQDGIAGHVIVNVAETDADGPLVPYVRP
jgi:hypothetical protein